MRRPVKNQILYIAKCCVILLLVQEIEGNLCFDIANNSPAISLSHYHFGGVEATPYIKFCCAPVSGILVTIPGSAFESIPGIILLIQYND